MTINSSKRQRTLRRIRWLKKEEGRLYRKFHLEDVFKHDYLWNEYFNMKDQKMGIYPMLLIDVADQETWQMMIDRFLDDVLIRLMNHFKEENKSIFALLDVSPDATLSDIKRAFRKKAMILHPDKGGDHESMQKLNEAYEKYKSKLAKE